MWFTKTLYIKPQLNHSIPRKNTFKDIKGEVLYSVQKPSGFIEKINEILWHSTWLSSNSTFPFNFFFYKYLTRILFLKWLTFEHNTIAIDTLLYFNQFYLYTGHSILQIINLYNKCILLGHMCVLTTAQYSPQCIIMQNNRTTLGPKCKLQNDYN